MPNNKYCPFKTGRVCNPECPLYRYGISDAEGGGCSFTWIAEYLSRIIDELEEMKQ